jgi:Superfamily II DNA/RNA helicases, SNF2 family
MRKLLNSPNLLFEDKSDTASIAIGAFNGQVTGEEIWNFSNKLLFTKQLIEHMEPSDKLIIVSYFTQTLDLIERICDATNSKFLRLDGQVAAV